MNTTGGVRRVVSVSLGSSKRDHAVEVTILGTPFRIERIGTDGDVRRAIALVRELDGRVDAFGMGGLDLWVRAGNRRYRLRQAVPIARAAQKTPIVDGGGLKDTLERRVVRHVDRHVLPLSGVRVLMVSAVDRFGMAEALVEAGARVTFGDLPFILGLPFPLQSLRQLDYVARVLGPIACQLPIHVLYPTGKKQEENRPKWGPLFAANEVIAGDFHLIRRYMPQDMRGKTILTNTVTRADVEELRRRGVTRLITTTPELEGRSFGTNVMEGVLVALAQKRPEDLTGRDYHELLDRMGFTPRVETIEADSEAAAAAEA